jgi:hypothetical protein
MGRASTNPETALAVVAAHFAEIDFDEMTFVSFPDAPGDVSRLADSVL